MNIILYGFKNAGKTTLGKRISIKLGLTFLDVDKLIEEEYAKTHTQDLRFSEIYQKHGAAFFRELEKKVLHALKGYEGYVIAMGGGSVLDPQNREILKEMGHLIYLKIPKEILKARFIKNPPVFADEKNLEASFEKLYAEREEIYENASEVQLLFNQSDPDKNAALLVEYIQSLGNYGE